ncbi:hypothetical protein [Mycoplasmoides alvi]|uniref:hypothetical protein n=1 Tax=Mycoplasmoides alvi TaxID=78580 RepID=UPI000697FB3A|nr:hypothetical protein [Mycoplasmoides alvi]
MDNKSKKKRNFVDLSDDSSENTNFIKKENKPLNVNNLKKGYIDSSLPPKPTNNDLEKNIGNKTHYVKNNPESDNKNNDNLNLSLEVKKKDDSFLQESGISKETSLKTNFEIPVVEPLNKGFHFYSNDRVMNKVKKFAKKKNIKLSRLITIILDKSIQEM